MNAKTLKALKASIAHWKRHAKGTAARGELIYSDDCALCSLYRKGDLTNATCNGCPVKEATGRNECHDTPWYECREHFSDVRQSSFNPIKAQSPEFRAAAGEMVKFLEGLLPKTKKTTRKNASK